MPKVIVYVKPKFEEYEVKVYTYDADGKLVDERVFSSVKQVVIRSPETRLSKQLFHEYVALIVDAEKPRIEVRKEGVLYIHG
ncbi:MAG: hypothetical protein QXH02_00395 [Desulfurococcaceae archaeon]